MRILAAAAVLVSTSAFAVQLPDRTFFSDNDIYQWCQHDKAMAQATSPACTTSPPTQP